MRQLLDGFFRYILYRAGYRGLRKYFGWSGMVAIGIIGLMITNGISPQEAWQSLMASVAEGREWLFIRLGR